MKSLRNPLLLTIALGGIIGNIASCNNAQPTTDATDAAAAEFRAAGVHKVRREVRVSVRRAHECGESRPVRD